MKMSDSMPGTELIGKFISINYPLNYRHYEPGIESLDSVNFTVSYGKTAGYLTKDTILYVLSVGYFGYFYNLKEQDTELQLRFVCLTEAGNVIVTYSVSYLQRSKYLDAAVIRIIL